MRYLFVLLVATVSLAGLAVAEETGPAAVDVRIVEVVADPQTDWTGDGNVTTSDEHVELYNAGPDPVDLTGWVLLMEDSTPAEARLLGTVSSGGRIVVWNPPGAINNDAVVRLLDSSGAERDRVAYGSYDATGSVPDANAVGVLDEALAWDGAGWVKAHATPAEEPDAVRCQVTHTFDVRGDEWLSPPNATRTVTVTAVHAARILDNLTLDDAPPAFVEGAPGHEVRANFSVTAGAEGRELWLNLTADGERRDRTVARLVVDAEPPTTPEASAPTWAREASLGVAWEASRDEGIGGVSYAAEVEVVRADNRTTWTTNTTEVFIVVEGLEHADIVETRVRAVDAYGNLGVWSAPVRTTVDGMPPTAVTDLDVAGSTETVVSWAAASDDGSGVGHYEVVRTWDGTTKRSVATGSEWTDPDGPRGGNLSYRVRAVDVAGSPGPWNRTVADHEALYPKVASIRVSKPVWTSGVQEVRIDFDRPMNTSLPPRLASSVAWSEARWLANASTYYLKAPGPEAAPQGLTTVRVEEAEAADGRRLALPSEATFRVDTIPPVSRFAEATGMLSALDEEDGAPRVFVKRWLAGETAPTLYVAWDLAENVTSGIEPGVWHLRFFAMDDVGNRENVQSAKFEVAAPAATPSASAEPVSKPSPSPTAPATSPPPAAHLPPAPSEVGDVGGLAQVDAERRTLSADTAGDATWRWWGVALGGLTAGGGLLAWRQGVVDAVARRWRRWRRPASLAVRLRRLRAKG